MMMNSISLMSNKIFLSLLALALLWGCAAKTQNLGSVPPPTKFPTEKDAVQVIDDIKISTNLYLWQDFMPKMNGSGPPFYLSLDIKLENNSKEKIKNFRAEKLTLYYDQTKKELTTFDLEPVVGDSMIAELATQESKELHCTNDRSKVFSPQLEKGERFYARILVWWDGKKRIITSVSVAVEFTY